MTAGVLVAIVALIVVGDRVLALAFRDPAKVTVSGEFGAVRACFT